VTPPLAAGGAGTGEYAISPDGRQIMSRAASGDQSLIWVRDLRTAAVPQPIFKIEIGNNASGPYAVSQDGQRFRVRVGTTSSQPSQGISVVMNWPATTGK
jgi:uncharacterized membrane protein